MNEAKLRDARNPEILYSVVKAKLRLKSAYPRRRRSENQFMRDVEPAASLQSCVCLVEAGVFSVGR